MRPGLALGGVTEQVHDDGTPGDGLVNLEQVLALNPAVLQGVFPRLAALPHTDDDVQAIVTQVQTLAVALGAVADEGEGVVLEVVLWELSARRSPWYRTLHGYLCRGMFRPQANAFVTHQELLLGPILTLCGCGVSTSSPLIERSRIK